MLWWTARLLFGAGGTQGGVKKLSAVKAEYCDWALKENTRALIGFIHHPLVTEYLIRLHEKRIALEKWQEDSVSDTKVNALVNCVDNSPFDYVRWNTKYRDELDIAEKVCAVLRQLDENVTLHDQLQSKSVRSREDEEIFDMAKEDIATLTDQLRVLEGEVNAVMERRIGSDDLVGSVTNVWNINVEGKAGGEEASLFAAELAEMYRMYATEFRNWKVRPVVKDDGSEAANSNEFQVCGEGVYRNMRHEIGVHKVQRVPVTDAAGKMQTSTAVFTMMPVLDPVSVDVHESDCKIDFVRGSGPGGQGMQSSSNCVVLTHKPSGISVKCHQSRSALGNKELALQTVAQQILVQRVKEQNSSLHKAWQNQWSSGERSDKMRTYNYPQNRVTDHRIGKDYALSSFMERGSGLKGLHDELNDINDREQVMNVLLKHIKGGFGSVV
ncbi:Peptide chain release factor 1 mitochondrial [Leishmania donovani]|uniref:Peptide chain release factor 1, mitochondrial, putative n=1 Tax=Leishmania donovani TaxID=5661 RepID=A0A3S7WZ74_LEIDO|nr:peptide chain release factor-like protein [Leishmania donovani]AYU79487.1 Peptide chain release factor 1, mitochondrial, putative [Leishmania donovani]TPP40762.1 RF-1 domain family protein [Leishmania donovani]TPP48886.1 RF-1 domain family protein [Leishmania donovani]CAJ1989477.1 Peptide chain release factor 1 mitochondrial [Leishmania donovani]CBZ34781.1 peptide chain release factor-like protein [Leishmania donovani]